MIKKKKKIQEEKELPIGLQLDKKLQEKITISDSDVRHASCPAPSF
jgi:hypothetical protein